MRRAQEDPIRVRQPTCGCRSSAEPLRTPAPPGPARITGRASLDRDALRRALGGRMEVVEALEAKASGRPGVNAARIWQYMTTAVYTSGDLPVLATREALQNARDAVAAAVRGRELRAVQGRFDVTWDPARRALTWEDNGVGMDAETILTKFLSLGDSGKADAADSGEAAGGFGVAKAVILGTSPTFRWVLHTRDNLAVSEGPNADVRVYDAPVVLSGTRITIFDVAPDFDEVWDPARRAYVPLADRLRELLAANDLPGLTLTFDGEEVGPMFSRRGGAKVAVAASWGRGTEATIKAYRRPPGDRQGAYYVRLGGLLQFRTPSQRGNLKADVVVDLATTVRPGSAGYPLNAARDALQDRASWAFRDLVDEVERENESAARSTEDQVFDPESDDADERRGASELADLAAQAFADEGFQRALADAAGGLVDFYAERTADPGVEAPTASLAPPGTRARPAEDQPTRALPPGMALPPTPMEPDVTSPSRDLRVVLLSADQARGGIVTAEVRDALDRADAGTLDGWGVKALGEAIDRATEAALEPGGGGLLQAATVGARGAAALDAVTPASVRPFTQEVRRNPFGKLAGLRISRKNYDRQRAYRFRKGFHRWMPHLAAWDATLRLVAAEAGIRRRFKPGFVLDDELLGLTTSTSSGVSVVYLHPDRLEQVIKAHRDRPLAIAAYLHGVAVHELTHLDGRMGKGHSEEYVASREDLGHATAHLLPAIALLAQRVLGLPVKPTDEARRIGRLERELAKARASSRSGRRASAAVERLQAELDTARADLAAAQAESRSVWGACGRACAACAGSPATRVLEATLAALRTSPPPGVGVDEVDAFADRNRGRLLGLVEAAVASRRG